MAIVCAGFAVRAVSLQKLPLPVVLVPKGGLDRVSLGGPRHLLRSKLLANATQLSLGGIGQMQGGAASG